jgi:flavodoxin
MKKILFIYATLGGNTHIVVESVADFLKQKGHQVTLQRAEKSRPEDMLAADFCVLASPTYGHGLLQEYIVPFVKALTKADLKGKPCAVISLGDPKYHPEYHLESASLLEDAIKKANGVIACPALRISRTPVGLIDTFIKAWSDSLLKII